MFKAHKNLTYIFDYFYSFEKKSKIDKCSFVVVVVVFNCHVNTTKVKLDLHFGHDAFCVQISFVLIVFQGVLLVLNFRLTVNPVFNHVLFTRRFQFTQKKKKKKC